MSLTLTHERALASGMVTEDMLREQLARLDRRSRERAGLESLLGMMQVAKKNHELRSEVEFVAGFEGFLMEEIDAMPSREAS